MNWSHVYLVTSIYTVLGFELENMKKYSKKKNKKIKQTNKTYRNKTLQNRTPPILLEN